MTNARSTIAVITVTWNSADTIQGCLTPFAACDDIEVIMVDNASADDTIARAREALPRAVVVQTGANCGFAAAVNAGIAASDAETVVLLNPDGSTTPDDVRRLTSQLDEADVVAPRIVDETGAVARSVRRQPTVIDQFVVAFGLHRVIPARDPDGDQGAGSAIEPLDVDIVSGACFATTRERFEELGGLDERFFLYAEEVDYCIRVRRHGGTLRYDPRSRAMHIGGVSAAKTGGGTAFILFESRVRLFDKHRGRLAAHLVRAALVVLALRRRDRRALRAMVRPLHKIVTPTHPTPTPTIV
ncbi:MAG: glycosyltransferase family 2 protein [Actinomycetota bacterium]